MPTDDDPALPPLHPGLIPLDFQLVQRARNLRGLTQLEVAHHIGVAYGTYVNWETGNHQPKHTGANLAKLDRLAEFLGLEGRDLKVFRPQDYPRRVLIGECFRAYRTNFKMTLAEGAQGVGLMDEAYWSNWEAGAFDTVGRAYQYRMLRAYCEVSGDDFESLFMPVVPALLRPCLAQWPSCVEPFVGRQEVLGRIGQWLTADPCTPRSGPGGTNGRRTRMIVTNPRGTGRPGTRRPIGAGNWRCCR